MKRRIFFIFSGVLLLVSAGLSFGLSFFGYSLAVSIMPIFGSTGVAWASTLLGWQAALFSFGVGLFVVFIPLCIAYFSFKMDASTHDTPFIDPDSNTPNDSSNGLPLGSLIRENGSLYQVGCWDRVDG